jgi:hypothetical protein
MTGCASHNFDVMQPIDAQNKTVTVEIHSATILPEVKRILRKHGWTLTSDQGAVVTETQGDRKKTYNTFKTMYRLTGNAEMTDKCLGLGGLEPLVNYEFTMTDGKGSEVFVLSGTHTCASGVVKRFEEALNVAESRS